MNKITWKTPPPSLSGNVGDRDAAREFREQLRAHPGKWAVYRAKAAAALAYHIGQRWVGFEATSRHEPSMPVGRAAIYVRYVGDPS